MVWFQCEDCGENLKKPKLPQHFGRCSASKLSCIDCGVHFNRQTVQAHTSCISEAEKYGPKGPQANGGGRDSMKAHGGIKAGGAGLAGGANKKAEGLDLQLGLSTRPPWRCSFCNVSATSQENLQTHAEGKKHTAKVRANTKAAEKLLEPTLPPTEALISASTATTTTATTISSATTTGGLEAAVSDEPKRLEGAVKGEEASDGKEGNRKVEGGGEGKKKKKSKKEMKRELAADGEADGEVLEKGGHDVAHTKRNGRVEAEQKAGEEASLNGGKATDTKDSGIEKGAKGNEKKKKRKANKEQEMPEVVGADKDEEMAEGIAPQEEEEEPKKSKKKKKTKIENAPNSTTTSGLAEGHRENGNAEGPREEEAAVGKDGEALAKGAKKKGAKKQKKLAGEESTLTDTGVVKASVEEDSRIEKVELRKGERTKDEAAVKQEEGQDAQKSKKKKRKGEVIEEVPLPAAELEAKVTKKKMKHKN